MFKYNGVEYRTREDAEDHIIANASILKCNYRIDEYSSLMKQKSDIELQLKAIASESEKAKENFIRTESAKITNQEHQFISTGFFIEGTIEKLTDTEMIMKCDKNYIAYDIIKSNNIIFTKPKPITIKRGHDTLGGYKPIGVSGYCLILQSSQNIIIAYSDMRNDSVRTHMHAKAVSTKVDYLKNAIIPLEEDRTFVSKWLMKNTNKE
jgi:hypothetical protein